MMNIQNIQNVSDCVPLYLPHSLYLKPVARMNISVLLPNNKLGKSISNLDIMDKLSSGLKPDKFLVVKVSKSTLDFIRFDAELDDHSKLRSAIARLDGIMLKISGFNEPFKVRASESKEEFPTRHDWDSFFRDASNMDEMKAGERPDTIYISHLPVRWFCPRHMENEENVKPSESIFRRIFEKFGRVRNVDIPVCDPYRNKMNADINGVKTLNFDQNFLFEAYVQFEEYVGFVRVMDEFRGMKLVRKFVDKTQAINIFVQFDKTKHLSDAQIQRRERVRKRLISKIQSEEEERERQIKIELERLEYERKKEEQLKLAELERQQEREERRKEKHLRKIQEQGQVEISQKIRIEERKLLVAQRKLESIRILEHLFDRIKLKHQKKYSIKTLGMQNKNEKLDLRDRLVYKYKSATEKLLIEQKKKVENIKNKTPILGLLQFMKPKASSGSEDENSNNKKSNEKSKSLVPIGDSTFPHQTTAVEGLSFNPFKAAVAAAAVAGGGVAQAITGNYSNEMTTEWMKSLSMFPYVPQVFPGMMFRPNFHSHVSNYSRGYALRMRFRGRGGNRGRGRLGSYDSSANYLNSYKQYNYEGGNYDVDDSYYPKSSHFRSNRSSSRNRSRSRSYSRSRNCHYSKRSRTRSRTRSRSRSYLRQTRTQSRSRSRSRSWSRSRSRTRSKSKERHNNTSISRCNYDHMSRVRSRSKTPSSRSNKKLVSTRRSRSTTLDTSRSRSRSPNSRAYRPKRSWDQKNKTHSRSRLVTKEIENMIPTQERKEIDQHKYKVVRSAKEKSQIRNRDNENATIDKDQERIGHNEAIPKLSPHSMDARKLSQDITI